MEQTKGNMDDLLLFLRLDKKKVTPGELPEATVILSNEGRRELLVNARLLSVPEGSPDTIGEIIFSIDGPPGSLNLTVFSVNAGRAKVQDFARLMPGETLVKSYDLRKYFRFTDPGVYKASVTYRNVIEISFEEMDGWVGQLNSNEETFEIQL
jgi:hypothetical protein